MRSLVVVEDEPDIADLLALYFRNDGWTVHVCPDGRGVDDVVRARRPDFVILDVGLPGDADGFEVCRRLRAFSDVPILFLTARDDEIDRILGLELGADDYVTKPFSPREVLVRAKAILRRGVPRDEVDGVVGFDGLVIDAVRHEVTVDGTPVDLAAQELALLLHLAEHAGQALSRDQLLAGAWGDDWVGDTRTVDVHVAQLRRKLGDALPLATVRGVGYRLG